MLQRIDRIATSWWFGDLLLLAVCSVVVVLAALITPSDHMLSLFGVEIPVVCSFRTLTGYGCPGCGLTRSFTFMAHGAIFQAFAMNPLGPPLFAVVASQLPWRGWRLLKQMRGAPAA